MMRERGVVRKKNEITTEYRKIKKERKKERKKETKKKRKKERKKKRKKEKKKDRKKERKKKDTFHGFPCVEKVKSGKRMDFLIRFIKKRS